MTLSAGTRLGPYEIISPLGAGGMGEVYKARDIRLDRLVAIKVLPAEVASDRERVRRFEQEARAASALNHPNILAVFDVGSEGPVSYIATELIEGKTLRDVLLGGPLPVKKLLDVAAQIAEGLSAAHESGIVHRDLKPANVIVSRDGYIKILDFGLAKLPIPAPKPSGESDATTENFADTAPGTIAGTVDYMSPEQASGRDVDYRSDQFAFGSILYEMATGTRAFRRGTAVETLAGILRDEPDISRIEFPVPLAFRWIIERCLAKVPGDRFVATRDLARDLANLRSHSAELVRPGETAARAGSRARQKTILLGAAILAAALAGLYLILVRAPPAGSRSSLRFVIFPPDKTGFNFNSSSPAPAVLSPDGRRIAFGATDSNGKSLLWVRALEALIAQPLPDTAGATYPFWSADSRQIGFFADGKLKRIEAGGGIAQTICEASEGRGGTWSRSGMILFAPGNNGPIHRVSDAGGQATPVTKEAGSQGEFSHRWPSFLPDDVHFLYLAHFWNDPHRRSGVYLGDLGSAETQFLIPDLSNAVFSPPGVVLFSRQGSLMAVPFDTGRLRLTAPPRPVGERVHYHPYRWSAAFTVSRDGRLAFQAANAIDAELSWFDRSGSRAGRVGPTADYGGIRLSPDGQRFAAEIRDNRTGLINIWILDSRRGLADRLTSGEFTNISPVWSPDGSKVAFASNRSGHWDLYQVDIFRGGPGELMLHSDSDKSPTDWSRDGRVILFDQTGPTKKQNFQIWTLTVGEAKASPYLQSDFNERDGMLSPDGQYVAYTSDESGQQEVYVRRREEREKCRVSSSGGAWPIWRPDGKELFYVAGDTLFVAVLNFTGGCRVTALEPVLNTRLYSSASNIPPYGVADGGRRFLFVTGVAEPTASGLTVVIDWPQGESGRRAAGASK